MEPLASVVTTTLGAAPELADKIKAGINSGVYERLGGVVRRTSDKQVMAWLRDVVDESPQASLSGSPLIGLMGVTAATSVLNLTITAIGFAVVIKKLDAIKGQLQSIQEQLGEMNRKLDLTFYGNVRAALDGARLALGMDGEANRHDSAVQALNRLLEAEHHYLGLVDHEFSAGGHAISPFLSTLMLCSAAACRCYVELGELRTSRQHLRENLDQLSPLVRRFYESFIAVQPAAYLHPHLEKEISLSRVVRLMRQQKQDNTDEEILEELRRRLWFTAESDPQPWLDKLPRCLWEPEQDGKKKVGPIRAHRDKDEKWDRLVPRLPPAFESVEQAHESMATLNGFELELDYLIENGISFEAWLQAPRVPVSPSDTLLVLCPRDSELLAH